MINRSPYIAAALLVPALFLPLLGGASTNSGAAPPANPPTTAPTFNKDIAPIVFANCASCHHAGEVAPFNLMSYDDVKKRAKQIVEVTGERFMPPWKAEAGCGEFLDARRLTEAQIDAIRQWAAAGAPEGNAGDLPKAPEFVDGWQLGKPDMVLEVPEAYTLRAEGRDEYRCFVLPIDVAQDTYVRAVEYRPSNRKIVHHCIMYLDSTGMARKLDAADPLPGYSRNGGLGFFPSGGLGGWAPGVRPRPMPEGTAHMVRKGTDLVLQTHLHPDGKVEQEKSRVGLYFAKEPPTRPFVGVTLGNFRIFIPPDSKNIKITDSYTLPADAHAVGIIPHAHLICKDMKATATFPDGTKQGLIHIPDWDFDWQEQYRYVTPVALPRGTRIDMEFTYDNTSANAHNPSNPPKWIKFGEQTTDEMALMWVQMIPDNPADARLLAMGGKRFLNAFAGGGNAVGTGTTNAPTSQPAGKGFFGRRGL